MQNLHRAAIVIETEHATAVDSALCCELIDRLETIAERMETVVPGYRRAYIFPGQE